ncbi:MAG TPA: hypothetical protein VHQ91_15640, partial [Geminicoccaceae bacterium]|nr:hypothetical protein [Geminicoccaceae bacterium]
MPDLSAKPWHASMERAWDTLLIWRTMERRQGAHAAIGGLSIRRAVVRVARAGGGNPARAAMAKTIGILTAGG